MAANNAGVSLAQTMLEGHLRFLEHNTGNTLDAKTDFFVLNPQGVLSNNRHFIAETMMEYQPNGDATTEGQAVLIIAHCYAYIATGQTKYLTLAKKYWDAYVSYFYRGQAVPNTPQRWVCNWLVNGKEPVLANFPVNTVDPTNGGYKSVPLTFTNGVAKVPQGSPFWGEYLDVASFAHRGHMSWPAINASVCVIEDSINWTTVFNSHRVTTMPANPEKSLAWVDWPTYLGKPAYTVDWSTDADTFPVDWIIAGNGDKVNSDGVISSGAASGDKGTIKLVNTSINGVYLVNYAVKLPVADGGYSCARNTPWHNRPILAPLTGSVNQMGNASDAEGWFVDACFLMWKLTGSIRYKKAMDCALFTANEYTNIGTGDKFFRQSTSAQTPFTDGTSYDYLYPNTKKVVYTRDVAGFIVADVEAGADLFLEQKAVNFRIADTSKCLVVLGGVGAGAAAVTAKINLIIAPTKGGVGVEYVKVLPNSISLTPTTHLVNLTEFSVVGSPGTYFSGSDGYIQYFTLGVYCASAYTSKIGDCTIENGRTDTLNYTPGVIPFSNSYQENQIGAWRGLPYPGYQSPLMYTIGYSLGDAERLANVVDFLYDAQQAYQTEFSVLGPVMSAYIWDRLDATAYGPANTWTMYHFGDGVAWSGYQPRAFAWAARAWEELVRTGQTVPAKLISYCNNWVTWLDAFIKNGNGRPPDDFPPTSLPVPNVGRATAHMTGLWLAGACYVQMAKSAKSVEARRVAEACILELRNNYIITPTPAHPMNGSWSPYEAPSTNAGLFYGFWSGEVMRGLSLYMILNTIPEGTDIYDFRKHIPD